MMMTMTTIILLLKMFEADSPSPRYQQAHPAEYSKGLN